MTRSIRVLHVDDDPEFTALTAEFIDREYDNIELLEAEDATTGVGLLADNAVDCVVSDYKLPDMDGIEFLRTVREEHPDLPFILFTGKGSEAVASEAISAGATDYFRKEKIQNQYELLVNRIENAVTATEDRKQAETKREEYRTLVEAAPVLMVVVDETGDIVFANDTAAETLGAENRAALRGTSFETFMPEDALAETLPRMQRVFSEREPVEEREIQFEDLEGTVRYGRGTIVPVTFEGEPAAQAVVSDITEQRVSERQLREQREQITKLHEAGVEIASCETPEEVYELMVETAESILDLDLCVADSVQNGRLKVEARSSKLTEYDEPPLDDAGIAGTAFKNGESYVLEDRNDHPEVDPVGDLEASLTVPVGEFGVFQAGSYEPKALDERDRELVEILAGHAREALTRLEQEKRLREQRDRLQRENERLDEFASIISHDLRNPLNVAQLRLNLAMDECDSKHLDAVERSVDRMETLTSELLALARLGDEVSELEDVDLSTIVNGCWRTVGTGDATLSVETDAVIRADESRLQQLFENLIRNAVEHGSTSPDSQTRQDAVEHGGKDVAVTVGTFEDGFYVADDGRGMDEQTRERAFESGFSTSEGGTGFGLAIVARVAEAHNWEVSIAETGEDAGARFEFSGVEFVS